ncbi:Maintenance of ploidy protein mob2 [Apophysomyces sp. BC1015]|nr:Maintenance of ploidy protein mob2 [Apophysomyces sp. BC1015]
MDQSPTFAYLLLVQPCLRDQGKIAVDSGKPSLNNFRGSVEYTWSDTQSKKIKLPAPQYIDYTATSIENLLSDEDIFPTKAGRDFPRDLPIVVKKVFGQLFRLFAHIYHHHYDKVLSLHEEPHFNSLFAHFISFSREFDLLDKKETQPLQELIDIMIKNGVIV